jgi:hypothetical protein
MGARFGVIDRRGGVFGVKIYESGVLPVPVCHCSVCSDPAVLAREPLRYEKIFCVLSFEI